MANVYQLYTGIATALILFQHCLAAGNVTDHEVTNGTVSDCHHHDNGDNCTADPFDTGQWNGHFSKCPEELTGYCIHGECRYIEQQKAPSCLCQHGYHGSRCEYVDLPDLRIGERRKIIIIGVVTGLLFLILVILFICFGAHRRCRCWRKKRGKNEERNGTGKHNGKDDGTVHIPLTADSTEPTCTDSV
ncbi:uncharacterized protein V6R79_011460 [Siganus canaliculatus]